MPHTLYLLRHGIAEDPGARLADADRALTAEGVRKTKQAAAGMKELGIVPEKILTSPLRRARETAEIVAEVLRPDLGVDIYQPLASGADPEQVIAGLDTDPSVANLFLVGHQPDLGMLASYLLTGTEGLVQLPFKKAGLAAVSVASLPPRSVGMLEWFLTPRQLRAIGRGTEVE